MGYISLIILKSISSGCNSKHRRADWSGISLGNKIQHQRADKSNIDRNSEKYTQNTKHSKTMNQEEEPSSENDEEVRNNGRDDKVKPLEYC